MNNIPYKRCYRCGETKPFSEFGKNKSRKDGFSCWCQACQRAYSLARTRADPEKNRARVKAWAEANPERVKEWHKIYYQQDKDAYKARAKEWKENNPERRHQIALDWQHRNSQQHHETTLRWRRANPAMVAIENHRRRDRTGKADYTAEQWGALCVSYGGKCLCCGSSDKLTVDHIVPLSKGGSNTIENIQPLCQICNSTKHDKIIDYRH